MNRKLQRSHDSRIFGVCGGLGEYFAIDPAIPRIIFLAALIMFGTGLLLYVLMALVMSKP